MGIYYPTLKGLKQFHMCNSKCVTIHYSWGEYTTNHYYTDEENDAVEQSIDNYVESQIDERVHKDV